MAPKDLEPNECMMHSGIKAQVDEHERRLNSGEERMLRIENGVEDIRRRLLGRPTWLVCGIISVLGALCTFLGTALVSQVLHHAGTP